MKVLIVEDEYTSRRYIEMLISKKCKYDIAEDGNEAMEKFKAALKQGEPFSVILLDIMMPKMSGQEVLLEVRNIEKQMDIYGEDRCKIIMTTALKDFQQIKEAFKNQADAYIVKPVLQDKLYQELEKLGIIEKCGGAEEWKRR